MIPDSRRCWRPRKGGWELNRKRRLLHPLCPDDPDLRIEHLALHRAFALGCGGRRFGDLPHAVHAFGDATEGGDAGGVAAGAVRIQARQVGQENEEIGTVDVGRLTNSSGRLLLKPDRIRRQFIYFLLTTRLFSEGEELWKPAGSDKQSAPSHLRSRWSVRAPRRPPSPSIVSPRAV